MLILNISSADGWYESKKFDFENLYPFVSNNLRNGLESVPCTLSGEGANSSNIKGTLYFIINLIPPVRDFSSVPSTSILIKAKLFFIRNEI